MNPASDRPGPNLVLWLLWILPATAVAASFASLYFAVHSGDVPLPAAYHWEGPGAGRGPGAAVHGEEPGHGGAAAVRCGGGPMPREAAGRCAGAVARRPGASDAHRSGPALDLERDATGYHTACTALPKAHWWVQIGDPGRPLAAARARAGRFQRRTGVHHGRFAGGLMAGSAAAHLSWQQDGDHARTLFFAEGMRCANCAAAIRRKVGALPGVERIDVNLATSRVSLAWQPSKLSLGKALETIEGLGFRPVPLSGESTRARARRAAAQIAEAHRRRGAGVHADVHVHGRPVCRRLQRHRRRHGDAAARDQHAAGAAGAVLFRHSVPARRVAGPAAPQPRHGHAGGAWRCCWPSAPARGTPSRGRARSTSTRWPCSSSCCCWAATSRATCGAAAWMPARRWRAACRRRCRG